MRNTSKLVSDRFFAASHTCVALAVAALVAGCGGGGGGGSAPSTSTSTTSTGSSTGTATTLFEQPQAGSIAGNLVVPPADNVAPPTGTFVLVLWQANPNTSNGQLVANSWDASSQTGFAPTDPAADQLGFTGATGTSTAQMQGNTVGAYINSQDLPMVSGGSSGGSGCGKTSTGAPTQKMMITPQYTWPTSAETVPFAASTNTLNGSMQLQVPVASGDAYVVEDLLFKDPNGVRVSFGIKMFANGVTKAVVGCGYDQPSNSFEINSPLGVAGGFVTAADGSAVNTGTAFSGWQTFQWSITQDQFSAALQYLDTQIPGQLKTLDPTQYTLAEVHLNAEIHFNPNAAELGWSMSGMKIWLVN